MYRDRLGWEFLGYDLSVLYGLSIQRVIYYKMCSKFIQVEKLVKLVS